MYIHQSDEWLNNQTESEYRRVCLKTSGNTTPALIHWACNPVAKILHRAHGSEHHHFFGKEYHCGGQTAGVREMLHKRWRSILYAQKPNQPQIAERHNRVIYRPTRSKQCRKDNEYNIDMLGQITVIKSYNEITTTPQL